MKLLLSAYACEPNKGSEPGVGWNWAIEIARLGHNVWIITRTNNKTSIDSALTGTSVSSRLHFCYCDLHPWLRRLKTTNVGLHIYYIIWQWKACSLAQRLHIRIGFDRVHHITFGSIRLPSFMGRLGIPFVFGPLGGGERAPWRLRKGYPIRGWIQDIFRDIGNLLVRLDPLMHYTFSTSHLILAKTPDTRLLLPPCFRTKSRELMEIGAHATGSRNKRCYNNAAPPLRVLFVGRFIYWKGMHLGLLAFARCYNTGINATLTLVGSGPEEYRWRREAHNLGLVDVINWLPWQDRTSLESIYTSHDVFLFPSLHDSSGNVVLEAMSYGLPVVCLRLGGPGVLVNDSCGVAVPADRRGRIDVVNALAEALAAFASCRNRLQTASAGALLRANLFSWRNTVSLLYG